MGGHIVMENSPRSHFHDHEYVKRAKSGRDHGEEVARHDHLGMVADEGQPSLLRIWLSFAKNTSGTAALFFRENTSQCRSSSWLCFGSFDCCSVVIRLSPLRMRRCGPAR